MNNVLVEIFGKTLEEAVDRAADMGYRLRVVRTDGSYHVVTRDVRADRVEVHLENNIVVYAKIG